MGASRRIVASSTGAALVLALVTGCGIGGTSSPASGPCSTAVANDPTDEGQVASEGGDVVVVGRIVTLDEPAEAQALLIERGVVTCIGSRDDVLAAAGGDVPVVDIGENVAYPGFVDAHAHWIGDRDYYGRASPEEAMDAALRRGWTSISEQWVNPERLDELEALAADQRLPIRVDAYLALNEPNDGAHLGDWYAGLEPGSITDRLRVRGLKITLDNGWGTIFNGWEPADLTETIGLANDAGWQVSVHTVSTEAHDMVLDAFEAAIGPTGPNPLHHRIEHAIQVTDEQLDRMAAMDVGAVVHLDGAAADWVLESDYLGHLGPDNPGEEIGWLARWSDFVDAGLHVAAASDTPWLFPDLELTDGIGRPVDQIAGGMDGRGRSNPETPEWVLDQLLTADQGLRAVTTDAAWALGDEANRGHLAPGTLGDVTILSGHLTSATADEVRGMRIIGTIVGGVVVFCADAAVCEG